MGRPSDYTPELAIAICTEIADGMSLRSICQAESMPDISTIMRWVGKHPEFRAQYAHAKEIQAEYFAEELLDIADDGQNDWMTRKIGGEDVKVVDQEALQRSRLRVDTRKWLMSKMLPKKYGDKLGIEHSGELTLADRISKARASRDGSGG